MTLGDSIFAILSNNCPTDLIANYHADIEKISIERKSIYVTVNQKVRATSWTLSPYAMVIDYGKDELSKLKPLQSALLRPLLFLLKIVFWLGDLDNVVGVNNYGLSTNLFSKLFLTLNKKELTKKLIYSYPRQAHFIRSVNAHHYPQMMDDLKEAGWIFLVNRQIYLIDSPKQALKRRDCKKDLKLLQDKYYNIRQLNHCSSFFEFQRAEELYNKLYLDKYSQTNVAFKAFFLQQMVLKGALNVFVWERKDSRVIDACIGIVKEEDMMTVPILGYDTDLPQKWGLYRRVSIFITKYAADNHLRLHVSAGAPAFKKSRGAESYLEYIAVNCQHLRWYQVWLWHALSWLTRKIYEPILVKGGL